MYQNRSKIELRPLNLRESTKEGQLGQIRRRNPHLTERNVGFPLRPKKDNLKRGRPKFLIFQVENSKTRMQPTFEIRKRSVSRKPPSDLSCLTPLQVEAGQLLFGLTCNKLTSRRSNLSWRSITSFKLDAT